MLRRKTSDQRRRSSAGSNTGVAPDATKQVSFIGTSLDDLRSFPPTARREAGFQLDKLQRQLVPNDWRRMPTIGAGVSEIRIRDQAGAFRVIYLATLPEAVYVLHAFQKKTQATSKRDLDLAKARLQELSRSLR